MITEISVENVALIEKATLRLAPGLNAITGETGAGKTLLATSLQLLLGGRARSETVRAGSGRATVEGTFVLPEETRHSVMSEALGDLADELDDEEEIVLRRSVAEEGRSRCYVNGVTVPVRALTALGERLVSYHSQREQARLTDPNEQLAILDDFLDVKARDAKSRLAGVWRDLRLSREQLESIRTGSEARLREADFLRFQVEEIESSGYDDAELEELLRERDRLRNVTGLMESVSGAASALSPEEGMGAVEAAAEAASRIEDVSGHDPDLAPLLERLAGASAELEDILYELRAYGDSLESDPNRLEVVEDRVAEYRALQRKYGEDVLLYLQETKSSLQRLENLDEETAGLQKRITDGEKEVARLAGKLSSGRESAAKKLSKKVRANLGDLNLGKTIFEAQLVPAEVGANGAERVEFVIQPNPGEPKLPVRKYASGGELSRVMLALRLAQERIEPGATYIFDEVDAGIGGETATAVGAKLRELGRRNQVLTITHLAQIASEATSHVVVAKEESGGRTITRIRRVEDEERRRELARMLSGRVDEASLAHAAEILQEQH